MPLRFLAGKTAARLLLRDQLKSCADIERIAARIAYGNAGPRDLVALADSLTALPGLKETVSGTGETLPALLAEALDRIQDLPETIHLIRSAIADDPPAVARTGESSVPGSTVSLMRSAESCTREKDGLSNSRRRSGQKPASNPSRSGITGSSAIILTSPGPMSRSSRPGMNESRPRQPVSGTRFLNFARRKP